MKTKVEILAEIKKLEREAESMKKSLINSDSDRQENYNKGLIAILNGQIRALKWVLENK